MKNPHSTKKTLVIACMLVYFFSACKRNDIPSPTHPPDKPEWLLSKIITDYTVTTFEYNDFNKPSVASRYTIGAKGDTISYSYYTYQYNMQKQLIQEYSYDSSRACHAGECFWEVYHSFNNYRYDVSGRISEKEFSVLRQREDTTQPSITTFSYQDTVVTLHKVDGDFSSTRTDTYNQQGNLLKMETVHTGHIFTHIYGPYDNAPNVISLVNLPVHPLYATIDEPISKNNPLKLVEKHNGDIILTAEYEYTYNKDSLVTQQASKSGSILESYEYIKAK